LLSAGFSETRDQQNKVRNIACSKGGLLPQNYAGKRAMCLPHILIFTFLYTIDGNYISA